MKNPVGDILINKNIDIGAAMYRRENFSYQKYGKILEFFHKNVKSNSLVFFDVKVFNSKVKVI